MATVHDEINISVPEEEVEQGMTQLRSAMDQDFFDVPMASEGAIGPNWHNMEGWDD
jgi:DNA polymerase I-like protein with 3'-5' exonuclease and polymerase domains